MATTLTRLLGIGVPVLQAPQDDPAAVAAFGRAGGLGVLAAGPGLVAALGRLRGGPAFGVQGTGAAGCGVAVPVFIGVDAGSVAAAIRVQVVDSPESARRAVGLGVDALVVQPAGDGMAALVAAVAVVAGAVPGVPLIAGAGAWDRASVAAVFALGAQGVQLRRGASESLVEEVRDLLEVADDMPPNPGVAGLTAAGVARLAARETREAAALRENLRRRKVRLRGE